MNTLLDRFPVHHISICVELLNKKGFEVVVATTVGNERIRDNSLFKEVMTLGDFDISKGLYFSRTPWVLSSAEIKLFSKYEALGIKLLSRFSLSVGNWSVNEMADHYYRLCNFWKHTIQTNKIDSIFSFYEPHDPSSFMLYIASKIFRIPYLFLDLPVIAGKVRFVNCSFTWRNILIHGEKNGENLNEVSAIINDYFKSISDSYENSMIPSMRLFYSKYALSRGARIKFALIKNCKKALLRMEGIRSFDDAYVFVRLIVRKILPFPPIFIKFNRSEWGDFDYQGNRFLWFVSRMKIIYRVRKLKKSYLKSCLLFDKVDLPEKFVLFAAPLEPEASNLPCAVNGSSVELFVDQLLSALPAGAKLVYRVNPAQFQSNYALYSVGIDFHRFSYYNDLKSKGVVIASTSIPMNVMINKSFAVATINGTVGAESIALGKPVVIAAPMWYDIANGVHFFNESSELEEFMELAYRGSINVSFDNINILSRSSFVISDIGDPNDLCENDVVSMVDRFASGYEDFKRISQTSDKVWSI